MRAVHALWARLVSILGRRRHPRRPSNLAVDWRRFGSQAGHVSALLDLSPGGAFVRAVSRHDVGSPIVLQLLLPLPTAVGKVNVHARVAWCNADGMGLRFTRPLHFSAS